ncbi:MAG: isopenicillin N synthase family oxygenase, partial [Acidimicrobiales bacterium]|nr:isopenicillin N synthase family oxygenase [Acidimicrobiales bacterium]
MDGTSFTEIPLVDVGRWRGGTRPERQAFADEVRDICHRVGFFIAVNHGVDTELTESVFATLRRLFALPESTKRQIDKTDSRHFRGWEPVGTESTNNRTDHREQIDLWTDGKSHPPDAEPPYLRLMGPNQWLDDAVLPGHRDVIERWIEQVHRFGDRLLAILSLGLGLAEDHLAALFGPEPMSLTKLIHYPPTPPGEAGVNGHHDTGFVTILAAGDTPGLEVQNPDGEWIPVPIVPDSFVINLGEMLQAITGNYFVATPHRVISATERYAAGHFLGPSFTTALTPLPLAPPFAEAVAASPRHAGAGYMA